MRVLISGKCHGSKVSIPTGGHTPSIAGEFGPIGYIACLKKDQNHARKNMTSDVMKKIKPYRSPILTTGVWSPA
jgi:hypothetical protein